ncbi:hypothetical protein A9Q86_15625 [Flavobacteriales bacterium 33_180_T64]|nr:hypothetical protein A9Q86_15625 [Flavobacteriales bacterium 33_180_T64]
MYLNKNYKSIKQIRELKRARRKIWVEGHTDNAGKSNMKLSKNRTKFVLMACTDVGIHESKLKSKSIG